MKNTIREDISKALDNLSDRYIEEVLNFEGKKKNKNIWLRFTAIAACLAIVIGAIIAVPMMKPNITGSISDSAQTNPQSLIVIPIVLFAIAVFMFFYVKIKNKNKKN